MALPASVAALLAIGPTDAAEAARKAKEASVSHWKKTPSRKGLPIRHPFGENMPKGPLQLVVSIGDQRAVLYSNGVRIADTRVSTGTADHPTPTGVFSVIQKNRWHRSNLYNDAPMYFMHRLTWSGIALHEGHLPGRPASHGCIRMPTDFVARLWNVSRLGMRVVVAHVDVAPREISHAKLFNPAQTPVDNAPRVSDLMMDQLRSTLDPFGSDQTAGQWNLVQVAGTQAIDAPTVSDVPDAAASPGPEQPGADPEQLPLPRPAPLRSRAAESAKSNSQVAVFISRKERRIFVRHAFQPLFDMPVEIADPDKPFGTHVYTAMEVLNGGARMRWNVISMPRIHAQAAAPRVGARTVGKQRQKQNTAPVAGLRPASNAVDAIDRVQIPQEAIDRISELLIPGSSLIISDEGLGRETGRYTEFIVETR